MVVRFSCVRNASFAPAVSVGLTIRPDSSIHTAEDTFTTPYSSAVTCRSSIRHGYVAFAARIHCSVFAGPPLSSATETTTKLLARSSS